MIQIAIKNDDGADDLFASVTDLNTNPASVPLTNQAVTNLLVPFTNQRIPRGAQQPVDVEEDGSGNCLVNVHTENANDATKVKDFNNQTTNAGGVISVNVF
jgi:hypothetical protein